MKKRLSKEAIIVSALIIISFIFRLIYLSHLKANDPAFYHPAPGTDMFTYHNFAQQILNGTFSKEPFYYGPLYYYFLALVYKIFGVNPYYAKLFQIIFGTATSFLIYLIAKSSFNRTVALISLIISILYSMFYIHEGVLLIAPLATFLTTLSIFLLLKNRIIISGIAIGLSALCRANILLFVPFILLWMRSAKRFGLLCLTILLTISPATIRNYIVSHRFVLISTNGPVNLWIGNHRGAPGEYISILPKKERDYIRKEEEYIRDVVRFIKEEPKEYLKLLLTKFLLFWCEYKIINNVDYDLYTSYSFLFKFLRLSFGHIALFGLVGIALSLRLQRRCLLLYFHIFSLMTAIVLFFVAERYRLLIAPSLIIFASFCIWWQAKKIMEKKIEALLLLILFPLSWMLVYSNNLYAILHPEGRQIRTEEGIVVKDYSDRLWHGKKKSLRTPKDRLKKEFILPKEIERAKEVVLWFQFVTGRDPGSFSVNINNKKEVIVSPPPFNKGYPGNASLYLMPELFSEGKNTIIFTVPHQADISLCVDQFYTFRRSFILKDEEWQSLKRGEFIMHLDIKKIERCKKEMEEIKREINIRCQEPKVRICG
jgi:4-amino-4-deoxy-L-arabinose transferase-like glycosyltransferase